MPVDPRPQPAYHPIELNCLQVGLELEFSIHLHRSGDAFILFLPKGTRFTHAQRQRLLDNQIDTLYISSADQPAYEVYVEQHIGPILADPTVPTNRKAELLYSVEQGLLRDIFDNPSAPDTVQRTEQVAQHTVAFLLQGPDVLHHLIRIMSDDYATFTHSINVCLLSVSLATQLGIRSRDQLDNLATGTLLHDIGKSEVPNSILKKRGPLNHEELELVRQHVVIGERLLHSDPRMNAERMLPLSQHHERLDGTGYPRRLTDSQIHLYGRIAAVADSFDAMTSERTYQGAMRGFEAISILRGRLREQYDQEVLEALIQILAKSQRAFRRAS